MRFAPFALIFAAACTPEGAIDPVTMQELGDTLQRGAHTMTGELPIVSGFERTIGRNGHSYVDNEIDVHLDATTDDWVMLGGHIELPVEELPEGEWIEIDDRDHWIYGCSGPSDRTVRWDRNAEAVIARRITVEIDGTPTYELSVVADFGSQGMVAAVSTPSLEE